MKGCEDHPTVLSFAQLFRLLCIYSPTKLRVKGNVQHASEDTENLDFASYFKAAQAEAKQERQSLRQGLEDTLLQKIVMESSEIYALEEHDYALPDPRHAVIYYLAGYVAKMATRFTNCNSCLLTLTQESCPPIAVSIVTHSKLKGELKFPSLPLYNLLAFHIEPHVENQLKENLSRFSPVVQIVESLTKLPGSGVGCCEEHSCSLVTSIVIFYLSVRVFFFTRRFNSETIPASKLVNSHRKRSKLV